MRGASSKYRRSEVVICQALILDDTDPVVRSIFDEAGHHLGRHVLAVASHADRVRCLTLFSN